MPNFNNKKIAIKDKIICKTIFIPEEIPLELLQSLKNNGKLIIPKKCSFENQKLVLIKKTDESSLNQKELINVKFVPLLNENIKH